MADVKEFGRRLVRRPTVPVLVAANLVPLLGVLTLDWDVGTLMLLFWAENGVIGFYAILRLAIVARWAALFLVPFFIVHFGMFMFGHLVFLVIFFLGMFGSWSPGRALPFADDLPWLGLSLLALVASHGFSFVQNFLLGDERRDADLRRLMMRPYARVAVLHVTIILGGIPVLVLGSPLVGLVLLVALKIAADVWAHLREHKKAAAPASP